MIDLSQYTTEIFFGLLFIAVIIYLIVKSKGNNLNEKEETVKEGVGYAMEEEIEDYGSPFNELDEMTLDKAKAKYKKQVLKQKEFYEKQKKQILLKGAQLKKDFKKLKDQDKKHRTDYNKIIKNIRHLEETIRRII